MEAIGTKARLSLNADVALRKEMKTAFVICLSMLTLGYMHLMAGPAVNEPSYEQMCAQASVEYTNAFKGTRYRDRIVFVSNPQISSEYLQSLKVFYQKNITHIDDAKAWFKTNGIPVAYESYNGCVITNGKRSKFSCLAQKIDATTWLIFLFGGYVSPEDRFNEAYLIRKNGQNERWIEDGIL